MKPIFFLITCIFCCVFILPCTAQKLRMGFLAGPNYTLANYDFPVDKKFFNPDDPGDFVQSWGANSAPGFFVGFDAQYDLQERIFASSSLILNLHSFNAKQKDTYTSGKLIIEEKYQFSVIDLQIPVLLNYRIGKISAGVGAFVAASLGGNLDFTQLDRTNEKILNSFSQALTFSNREGDYSDFRAINTGLRVELGYGIKRWRLAGHFDLGMSNLAPKASSGDLVIQKYPIRRSNFGLSLLYQPWPR